MADFCIQCWGEAEYCGDLSGISKPSDTAKGLYASVLCEGCVNALVDHTGRCVSPYCEERHGIDLIALQWFDLEPMFNFWPELDYVECFCDLAFELFVVNANTCCELCDSVSFGNYHAN